MAKVVASIIAVVFLGILIWLLISAFFGWAIYLFGFIGVVAVIGGLIYWRTRGRRRLPVPVAGSASLDRARERAAHRELKRLERRREQSK